MVIVWTRVINVAPESGALVVKVAYKFMVGNEVTVQPLEGGNEYYGTVQEYSLEDGSAYAAVFPALPPGNYRATRSGDYARVTVFAGNVVEVTLT
jgi:hypothetical protein